MLTARAIVDYVWKLLVKNRHLKDSFLHARKPHAKVCIILSLFPWKFPLTVLFIELFFNTNTRLAQLGDWERSRGSVFYPDNGYKIICKWNANTNRMLNAKLNVQWYGCRPRWKANAEILLSSAEPEPPVVGEKRRTSPWKTVSCSLFSLTPVFSSSSSWSTLSEPAWGAVSGSGLVSSSVWYWLSAKPPRRGSSLVLQWMLDPPSAVGESVRWLWDLEARCFLRNFARRFLNQTCHIR